MTAPLRIWPGMSFGDFLMQEVPDDWPQEEHYWQPGPWHRIVYCEKCGNPCRANAKWMPKCVCSKCPDGYDGGIP